MATVNRIVILTSGLLLERQISEHSEARAKLVCVCLEEVNQEWEKKYVTILCFHIKCGPINAEGASASRMRKV